MYSANGWLPQVGFSFCSGNLDCSTAEYLVEQILRDYSTAADVRANAGANGMSVGHFDCPALAKLLKEPSHFLLSVDGATRIWSESGNSRRLEQARWLPSKRLGPTRKGRPRQGSFIDTDMEFVEQFEWPTMEAVSFALKAVLQFRW